MIRCIHHAPNMAHMAVMVVPPESMIHRNAIQGGVVTMKGDIKNPLSVGGAHTVGYKLVAI